MENNVIFFSAFHEEKFANKRAEDVIISACILALVDTTQEINRISHILNNIAPERKERRKIVDRMAEKLEPDALQDFYCLLHMHGKTLFSLSQAIKHKHHELADTLMKGSWIKEKADLYLNSGNTHIDTLLDEYCKYLEP